MNWKRIIGAGSVVVAAVAVVFFAKTCSDQRVSDAIQESYKTIADTKQELVDVRRQNDSLRKIVEYRDSVAAPRDSVPVKKTAARDSGVIVVRHTTTPTVTRRAVASRSVEKQPFVCKKMQKIIKTLLFQQMLRVAMK